MKRPARSLRLLLALACAAPLACSVPAESGRDRDERPDPRCPTATWASAYGDPALVPTREGEQIRRDLATAAAIREAALASAHDLVHDVHVVFRGGQQPASWTTARTEEAEPGAAHVIVTPRVGADIEPLRRSLPILVAASVREPWTPAQTTLEFTGPVAEPDHAGRGARGLGLVELALAMALIGFGASMGISLDRLAARRRR